MNGTGRYGWGENDGGMEIGREGRRYVDMTTGKDDRMREGDGGWKGALEGEGRMGGRVVGGGMEIKCDRERSDGCRHFIRVQFKHNYPFGQC